MFSVTCVFSNLAYELVIVDDASPDGTQEVATQLQSLYGEEHIVRGTFRKSAQARRLSMVDF